MTHGDEQQMDREMEGDRQGEMGRERWAGRDGGGQRWRMF